MRPPIEPTPEQVTSDAQGKIFDMTAEQENIEGVYAPPPVSRECAQQNTYHDIFVGYGPPPVLMQQAFAIPQTALAMPQQPAANPPQASWLDDATWKCACGAQNKSKFCMECGAAMPEKPKAWVCACGAENNGKFCTECGRPRPETWICTCGTENKGKFCMNCGKPRG